MNEVLERQLRKLNEIAYRRKEEPENFLYQFREHQAQEEIQKHIILYGAVGYPLEWKNNE